MAAVAEKIELGPVRSTADDRSDDSNFNLMLIGPPGSGKSSQFNTLPGRKFLYIFDPNVKPSLHAKDIEYLEFRPDIMDLDLAIKTLRKERGEVVGDKPRRGRRPEPLTYPKWEADYEDRIDAGFFEDFDWIGFDGLTTFLDIIMDRVLFLNDRLGKWPEQDDWTAQINAVKNIFRVATSVPGCSLFATAHTDLRQDEQTKRIHAQLMVTGRLRTTLPLMFDNIWACENDSDKEGDAWVAQTRPDREHPTVRTSFTDLEYYEAMTIDWTKPLQEQGAGRIFTKHGFVPQSSAASQRGTAAKRKSA